MAITKDFKETVALRARRDSRFRIALLTEAVNELLSGDVTAGKSLLRDYIKATTGFVQLAGAIGKPDKSIQRMLGPSGNPTADNIFAILRALQDSEKVELTVRPTKAA